MVRKASHSLSNSFADKWETAPHQQTHTHDGTFSAGFSSSDAELSDTECFDTQTIRSLMFRCYRGSRSEGPTPTPGWVGEGAAQWKGSNSMKVPVVYYAGVWGKRAHRRNASVHCENYQTKIYTFWLKVLLQASRGRTHLRRQ